MQNGTLSPGVLLNAGSLTNGPLASAILPSTVAYISAPNTFTQPQTVANQTLALTGASGFITSQSSITTTGSFFGDGSHLGNVTATQMNASGLINGPVASSILPSSVAYTSVSNSFSQGQSFTATGNTQYSLQTSSGINVAAGGVTALFFSGAHYGDGSKLTGVIAAQVAAAGVQNGTLNPGVLLNAGSLTNGPLASAVLPSTVAYTTSPNSFSAGAGNTFTYGITAGSLTVNNGLTASSGTFTATGNTQYSLQTSSGINVQSGTVLVQGSGGLIVTSSIAAANFAMVLYSKVILGAAAATLDTGNFPAVNHLRLVIDTPGLAAAGMPQLQFNNDATVANYNDSRSESNSANTSNLGTLAQIRLKRTNSANPQSYEVIIGNVSGAAHPMLLHGTADAGAGTAPVYIEGGGVYRATAQITRIVLSNSAAANFNAGTRMMVFGSND